MKYETLAAATAISLAIANPASAWTPGQAYAVGQAHIVSVSPEWPGWFGYMFDAPIGYCAAYTWLWNGGPSSKLPTLVERSLFMCTITAMC
jgi:hypothetical protein